MKTGSYNDEDDGDLEVLAQLTELGSDLLKPRHCIHYFYFATKQDAKRAGEQLEALNLAATIGTELSELHSDLRWPVTAEHNEVINSQVIRDLRKSLKSVAEAHHGQYDGWQAVAD